MRGIRECVLSACQYVGFVAILATMQTTYLNAAGDTEPAAPESTVSARQGRLERKSFSSPMVLDISIPVVTTKRENRIIRFDSKELAQFECEGVSVASISIRGSIERLRRHSSLYLTIDLDVVAPVDKLTDLRSELVRGDETIATTLSKRLDTEEGKQYRAYQSLTVLTADVRELSTLQLRLTLSTRDNP